LEQVRADITGLTGLAARIADEYEAGDAPFQRFAPTRAMVHDFLSGFGEFVDSWAARSLAQIDAWQAMDGAEREVAAIDTFRKNRARPYSPPAAPIRRAPHSGGRGRAG
jgi:hypothetical protein